MFKSIFPLILTIIFSTVAFAQSYTVVPQESKVIIEGTSNVKDWESEAQEFTGTATIEMENDSLISSISDLEFKVLVDGIKSGKSGMDDKTYDALNKKKYPNITFVLSDISNVSADSLIANGELTISGVTNTIQMEVAYEILPDGSVSFKGTQPITMTDYDVDPPSAMFGAIKAGADVDVIFDAKFAQ